MTTVCLSRSAFERLVLAGDVPPGSWDNFVAAVVRAGGTSSADPVPQKTNVGGACVWFGALLVNVAIWAFSAFVTANSWPAGVLCTGIYGMALARLALRATPPTALHVLVLWSLACKRRALNFLGPMVHN